MRAPVQHTSPFIQMLSKAWVVILAAANAYNDT